ncbi:MAG: transcriptional regulator [Pseudomonadota bacterium]
MRTHAAKRIEIIIEAPLLRRLSRLLDEAGAPGYTVLPVLAGSGVSGPWTRDGQVSAAGGMCTVLIVTSPEKAEALMEAAFEVVEPHIGIVSMTDCQVVRPQLFDRSSGEG